MNFLLIFLFVSFYLILFVGLSVSMNSIGMHAHTVQSKVRICVRHLLLKQHNEHLSIKWLCDFLSIWVRRFFHFVIISSKNYIFLLFSKHSYGCHGFPGGADPWRHVWCNLLLLIYNYFFFKGRDGFPK